MSECRNFLKLSVGRSARTGAAIITDTVTEAVTVGVRVAVFVGAVVALTGAGGRGGITLPVFYRDVDVGSRAGGALADVAALGLSGGVGLGGFGAAVWRGLGGDLGQNADAVGRWRNLYALPCAVEGTAILGAFLVLDAATDAFKSAINRGVVAGLGVGGSLGLGDFWLWGFWRFGGAILGRAVRDVVIGSVWIIGSVGSAGNNATMSAIVLSGAFFSGYINSTLEIVDALSKTVRVISYQ